MAQYVFTMSQVGKIVPPKKKILENISLSFFPGAKIGVLGLNGSGKSTLLRIMAGHDRDILGEARPLPGIKIGYLEQEPQLDVEKDVRGNVEKGFADAITALQRLDKLYEEYAEPGADFETLAKEQSELEDLIQVLDAHNLEHRLEIAASALRLPPWDSPVNTLSGGERRRVALCQLLLSSPDMLLLDEPTNHLDAESVAWLERFLEEFPGTVVAITHDRYFLDNAANWILELDRGTGIPYEGNYSDWLSAKEIRLSQEQRKEVSRQKAIKAELDWVRSNPKGRQAKSKARLKRFEELSSQDFQSRNETNEIYIPPGERLGENVIEIVELRKSFGKRLIFENMSLSIPRGSIVGIIGANGMGKSTLFKILIGSEEADSGKIKIGETVKLGYVDQSRENLNNNNTVWQEVSEGLDVITIGNYEINSRSYLGRFNFKGSDQQKYVKDLSGGERNRLHLAKLLKQGANVLLLDEPTNDLDVETLRALEEALLAFPGSAMVISHDRWFLDRISTHILAFDSEGEIIFHEGNFSDYEQDRKSRSDLTAQQPKKIKYRKLK